MNKNLGSLRKTLKNGKELTLNEIVKLGKTEKVSGGFEPENSESEVPEATMKTNSSFVKASQSSDTLIEKEPITEGFISLL